MAPALGKNQLALGFLKADSWIVFVLQLCRFNLGHGVGMARAIFTVDGKRLQLRLCVVINWLSAFLTLILGRFLCFNCV